MFTTITDFRLESIIATVSSSLSIQPLLVDQSYCVSQSKISECLASSTSHALFILLNKDSASQHEAIIFHSEEKKHPSELAIALYFVEDLPQDRCKFIIEKKSKENTPYYICNSEDFNNQCLKIEKDCFFTKQVGLSASHIQLFINNTYSKLILLDQHSNITNIILELIE